MPELKERLEALADQGEPLGAAEVMRRARQSVERADPRRVSGQRVLVSLVAAAAVVAIVVGAFVVAQRPADRIPSVRAGAGDEGNASTPEDGQTLYLVPRFVPEGFELVRAEGGGRLLESTGLGSRGAHRIRRYVRFDAAHEHPVEILDILWGGAGGFMPPVSLSPDLTPLTVRGRAGSYSPAYGTLTWEEQEGQTVSIVGTVARATPAELTNTSLPLELLQAAADGLVPTAGGGFELPSPPGGFDLVAEAPGEFSLGTNPRTLAYEGPDDRAFEIRLVDDNEWPAVMNLYYSSNRLVEVRGVDGVLTSYPPPTGSEGWDGTLEWVEPGDVSVTISGVGMSASQLLAVAEQLERVDTRTWFDLERALPDDVGQNGTAPSQVRVLVLNAGAMPGSASEMANSLRAVGYNVLPAADTPLLRTGRAVQCRAPFDSAATALALAVASDGGAAAAVEAFADPGVASAGDADCLVYVGA